MFSTKSPIIFFQTVVSSIAGYISLFFILRYIGPYYWGLLSYAMAFGALFSFLLDMGFNTTYLKFISSDEDKKTNIKTYTIIKLVLNAIYLAVIIGALLIWVYVLRRGFENPLEFWIIIAILPYFSVQSFIPVLNSYFQATFQAYKLSIPRLIESLFRNSIFVFLGVLIYLDIIHKLTANIVVVMALVYDVSYIMYFVMLFYSGRPWHFKSTGKSDYGKYIKFALPLSLSTTIGIINLSVDKVIVQFFWGAIATGALYADQRLVSIVGALTLPIGTFLIPLLSSGSTKSSAARDKDVIEYERILSLLITPFVLAFVLLSPFILNIINGTYLYYWPSFSVIAIGTYIGAIMMPFNSSITAMGKQFIMAKISLISIFLNISLNIVLIPKEIFGVHLAGLGVLGATISFTVAEFVAYVLYKELHRKLSASRTASTAGRHIIVALPTGLVFVLAALFIKPYPFLYLIPVILGGFLLYAVMSIAMKEITWDQITTILKNIIPIKKHKLE